MSGDARNDQRRSERTSTAKDSRSSAQPAQACRADRPISEMMLTELVGAVETPSIPESSGGMVFAVALVAAILVADRVLGNGLQLMGLLALPACVAAIFVGPRRTLLVAALQLAAGIGWGYAQGSGADLGQVLRMSGVVIGGAAAFALSSVRTELDLRLRAVTQIADLTQAAVLRPIPSVVGPAEVAVRYVSATAGARVGGDFYEVLPFAGGVRFIVGDVRGKGIGAVRLASVLVGAFRAADHDDVAARARARRRWTRHSTGWSPTKRTSPRWCSGS